MRAAALALVAALSAAPAAAETPKADNFEQLSAVLHACLGGLKGTAGDDLTIVFSVRRDGSPFGEAKIAHEDMHGDAEANRRELAAIADALAKCLPLPLTPSFGAALAGRPIRYRLRFGADDRSA